MQQAGAMTMKVKLTIIIVRTATTTHLRRADVVQMIVNVKTDSLGNYSSLGR